MKPIILKENNIEKIEQVLKEVQKRSKVRNITVDEIFKAAVYITNEIKISKKAMNGTKVYVDLNADKYPNAYKFNPESTHFTLLFDKGKWRVTNIARTLQNKSCPYRYDIVLSETAKEAILNRYSRML